MVVKRQLRAAAPHGAHTVSGKRPDLVGSASCHPSEGLAPSWVHKRLLIKTCHFLASLSLHPQQTHGGDKQKAGELELIPSRNKLERHPSSDFQCS